MKSFIVVFALVAAVSCDVSEIFQGDGWSKDASGYHYDSPSQRLDQPSVSAAADFPVDTPYVEEVYVEEQPYADVGNFETAQVSQDYLAPTVDYLPPNQPAQPQQNLREYLPPDLKRKRQVPARRQVRKVYRRFLKRH